jgi:hypothetical protein
MKTDYIQNTITLAVELARRPDQDLGAERIASDAMKLQTLGRRADSASVALCNGWIDQDKHERKAASIRKSADAILTFYSLRAKVGGDPRGYCLKIVAQPDCPPFAFNTWGGQESGYGV